MLTFPNDHDVILSIPCGIDGSRRSVTVDYIDSLFDADANSKESDYENNTQFLVTLIPCKNTRLCLLRIADGEISYTMLANLWGIHRGSASRRVSKYIEGLL